jgi:PAT family beta-lactamase induction signal transducer AmpG
VTAAPIKRESWLQALCNRRMLICVFTGFSSGLPLFVLLQMVQAWLRSEHVDLKSIAVLGLLQFPYLLKFLWAPLLDRYALPGFGRRRGWMLVSQIVLLVVLPMLGMLDPLADLRQVVVLIAIFAFASATQDAVLDAYRRELLNEAELGLGTAFHVNAYRIAGLVPGSLALILSDHLPWNLVFLIVGLFMLPGIAMTLAISEPKVTVKAPKGLVEYVIEPFREFFKRAGWRYALILLAFFTLYKLGDATATTLATPFYIDMGFSRTQIGIVAKNAGLWANVAGGFLGGLLMVKLGINRALWLFGVVQMGSILGFALLTQYPGNLLVLGVAVGFEALGVGLGTVALLAFMARATNPAYTATQFALFSSCASIPRVLFGATTGAIVERLGWLDFYFLCVALAIPGMLLLFKVAPWNAEPKG